MAKGTVLVKEICFIFFWNYLFLWNYILTLFASFDRSAFNKYASHILIMTTTVTCNCFYVFDRCFDLHWKRKCSLHSWNGNFIQFFFISLDSDSGSFQLLLERMSFPNQTTEHQRLRVRTNQKNVVRTDRQVCSFGWKVLWCLLRLKFTIATIFQF